MALIDKYNLRHGSAVLRNRIAAACATAALDVLYEADTTPNYTQRRGWAISALTDASGMAERMMWAVIADATIATKGEAATDAEIQNAVNGRIDLFAVGRTL